MICKVSVKTFSIISWNVPARRKRQKIGSGSKGKLRKRMLRIRFAYCSTFREWMAYISIGNW